MLVVSHSRSRHWRACVRPGNKAHALSGRARRRRLRAAKAVERWVGKKLWTMPSLRTSGRLGAIGGGPPTEASKGRPPKRTPSDAHKSGPTTRELRPAPTDFAEELRPASPELAQASRNECCQHSFREAWPMLYWPAWRTTGSGRAGNPRALLDAIGEGGDLGGGLLDLRRQHLDLLRRRGDLLNFAFCFNSTRHAQTESPDASLHRPPSRSMSSIVTTPSPTGGVRSRRRGRPRGWRSFDAPLGLTPLCFWGPSIDLTPGAARERPGRLRTPRPTILARICANKGLLRNGLALARALTRLGATCRARGYGADPEGLKALGPFWGSDAYAMLLYHRSKIIVLSASMGRN